MVEYYPISAKDLSRQHQFGPQVLPSICLGYALSAECGRGEEVQDVLTLFCSGAAQVCHVLRVVELKEQLEVEEEDGDRQEEEVEVERRNESRRVRHVDDHGWSVKALRT